MSKLGLLLFLLFSCQVVSDSLWLQETAGTPGLPVPHHLPVCPSACPLSQWCHPTFCHPLFLPSIFPESGSFPVSQLFAPGGKSTVVSGSVSVLSMNTQDWFPLGWTGWISLQSKGLSRVFSTPQFKSTSSSALSFLYSQTLTCTHDHWEDHGLDCMGLCQQNEVFTF